MYDFIDDRKEFLLQGNQIIIIKSIEELEMLLAWFI